MLNRCNTNTQGNLFSIESRFPNVVYISILYLHTYFIGIGKYVERLRKLERDANSVPVSHEQKIEDSFFTYLYCKECCLEWMKLEQNSMNSHKRTMI